MRYLGLASAIAHRTVINLTLWLSFSWIVGATSALAAERPNAVDPSLESLLNPKRIAQTVPLDLPPLEEPKPLPPLPEPVPLPSPEDLLRAPNGAPEPSEPGLEVSGTIVVTQFKLAGNTAFSNAELQAVIEPFTNRPITFTELLEARTAITQTYVNAGYINSGAYIPANQRIDNGVVEIRIVEGSLEAINIEGLGRLNPDYIRSRIAVRTGKPLNVNSLVEALQLLQLNPLIKQISAELATGTTTGSSVLNLTVTEANVVAGQVVLDNSRSPLVGSFRRQALFSHGNLAGQGDRFSVSYSNTDGSNSWDLSYAYPFNPYNGTLEFFYSGNRSRIIEPAFEFLGIRSRSDNVQLTVRQPIHLTPSQELALGLGVSYSTTGSTLQPPGFPRFPLLSEGSDSNGNTSITALRFTQEWTQRGERQVLAMRSQFSLGTDWFGATLNGGNTPNSNFFSWQGQTQYVQIFNNNSLLLLRLNGQLSDRPLLSSEQFRLGGQGSVRGYRQDKATTDNGLFASIEARLPVLNIPESESSMQLAPFIDYGWGWSAQDGSSDHLLSVGTGMIWQFSNVVSARLDYGIPLIDTGPRGNSIQESGFLFSITAEVF